MKYRLIHSFTGKPVYTGQKVETFRHEVVTVESTEPPRHEGSTGRVYCRDAEGRLNGWYPSVVGCKFVEAK